MASLPKEVRVELGLDEAQDPQALRQHAARALSVAEAALPEVRLLKRSLDARRGRVRFSLLLGLGAAAELDAAAGLDAAAPLREVALPARVVIVGAGPAGLFCALELARAGVASVIVERGKLVQPRRRDLRTLNRFGIVDPDSNYCYGEGGAGTYSDGKLYTRSHKRGNVRDVIETLVRYGAPPSILTEARPHIGSNRLPQVITAMREALQAVGVEFRFEARVSEICVEAPGSVTGVRLQDGTQLTAQHVVVACGHSARDVHAMLERAGAMLERKPFAIGVRMEHPQPLINRIQYGGAAGHPRLPAAAYRLAHEVDGRGVFSFCMCPGGWIVPAATEQDGLVVNGMSLSRRDSPYANSGLVSAVEVEDLSDEPWAGVELQRRVEVAAAQAGGGKLCAPATRISDFLQGRASTTLPASSYVPGLAAADLRDVFAAAGLPLAKRLREALAVFARRMRGFDTEEAVLVGVETRTSSPLRVRRNRDTLQAEGVSGLFPCGEGAGYAGGIVSAAVDGMRVAQIIRQSVSVSR